MQDQKENSFIDLLSKSLVLNLDDQTYTLEQPAQIGLWRREFQEYCFNSIAEKHLRKTIYK